MALIKQDGSQQFVQPANGVVFSQEEIHMYADLGWVLIGTGVEMDRESRPEKMDQTVRKFMTKRAI